MSNTCTIHSNTYQDTCQYLYAGRKPVCWTDLVLVCIWHVSWYVLVCIGMYLVCNGMYSISVQHTGFCPAYKYWHACILAQPRGYIVVINRLIIVNIPIWCHTALESTFNAISTVDTAEMSLCLDFQSTLWQDGQKERPWQLPVPDLTTLSHSPPGEHISTLPCKLCGMDQQLISEAGVPRSWTLAQSRQGLGR